MIIDVANCVAYRNKKELVPTGPVPDRFSNSILRAPFWDEFVCFDSKHAL